MMSREILFPREPSFAAVLDVGMSQLCKFPDQMRKMNVIEMLRQQPKGRYEDPASERKWMPGPSL
jgi:hypothetical protein